MRTSKLRAISRASRAANAFACALVCGVLVTSCSEEAAPTRSTELTVNVDVPQLSADGISAAAGEVVVGQLRSGNFQVYGRAQVTPTGFGTRVPVATKLDCGSTISCTVSVRLRLMSSSGAQIDSAELGPYTMAGGETPSVSGFTFRRVSRLQVLDSVLAPGIGQIQTMRVRLLDASDAVLLGRTVAFVSSDPRVATVDTGGRVTGVGPGRATITASRDGRSGTGSVSVNVVESFTLTASVARVLATLPVKLTATLVVPAGANRRVLYRSSDATIATVDTGGVVTTRRDGTVTFTAIAEVDTTQRRTVSLIVDPFRAATAWKYQVAADRTPWNDHIRGVWGQRSDSVFAITCSGQVNRWDGTAWRSVTNVSFCPLGIAGTSGRNIFLVGNQIWRFDGTTWARENVTQPANLEWAAAAEQFVFAVGNNGLIMRRDATSWSVMPSGTTANIRTVSAWNSNTVWAAGDARTVLRLVNGAWTPAPSLPATVLDCAGIYVRSPTEVFVSCSESGYGWAVYRWDGNAWARMDTDYRQRQWSFVPVLTTLYAVGEEGMVMRLDGSTWRIDSPSVGESRMVGGFGDANGAVLVGWQGVSYARRSGTWELASYLPSYRGIWGDGSGFIVGVGVQGAIDAFDGTRWTSMRNGGGQGLISVWGASRTAMFATGYAATMLRYNGTSWQSMTVPTTQGIPSVWGVRADSVWAVTWGGEILFFDGTSWRLQFRTGRVLRGIHGTNANNIWAVGDEGRIWRFDGRVWAREESSSEGSLQAVRAFDDRVFAVGGTEILERRNGEWRPGTLTPANQNYFWLAGSSSRDVYVGGCGAITQRFDGTAWTAEVPTNVNQCAASGFALPGGGVVLGGFFRDLVSGTAPNGTTPGIPR